MKADNDTVLSFVLPQPLYFNRQDGYTTNYINLIDFFNSLAGEFRQVRLIIYVISGQKGAFTLRLRSNLKLVPVPFSTARGPFWRLRLIAESLNGLIRVMRSGGVRSSDVIGFVGLSGLGTASFILMGLFCPKPHFFLLRGDRLKTVYFSTPGVLKRLFKGLRIKLYERLICREARRGTPVFTQGSNLYVLYKKCGRTVYPLNAVIGRGLIREESFLYEKSKGGPGDIRLLYVGRLSGEKNVAALVDIFDKLAAEHPFVVLDIVGSGPLEDGLRRRISTKASAGRIRLCGFIPYGEELFGFYDRADILILPSLTEGLPRSLAEALARGCIVCASRVGGIPYVIKDGVNGFLFSPYGESEVISKINQAIALTFDVNRRLSFLRKGVETAGTLTFEQQGKIFSGILREYSGVKKSEG